jgi:hypothetical protein
MSQQMVVGQGAPTAAGQAGRGGHHHNYQGRDNLSVKGFKSAISKIANNTFNTGKNCFAVQFTQS